MTKPVDLSNISSEELQKALDKKLQDEKEARDNKLQQLDELEQETATAILEKSKQLHAILKGFKTEMLDDLDAYNKLRHETLEVEFESDKKSGFMIHTEDKSGRVRFAVESEGFFDSNADLAEQLILKFVEEEFGENSAKEFILTALSKTKGKLDIKQVQRLYSLEDKYTNENWKKGIKLLKDSWKQGVPKIYLRVYEADAEGKYQQISNNFSSIQIDA